MLDIRGGQIELDRSVLERITAPFEHMLRNAVAHGLETPAERVAHAASPRSARSASKSRQEGNEVVLTVADDGAGLDFARIRAKRVGAGPASRCDDEPSDAELAEFIFQPGLHDRATSHRARRPRRRHGRREERDRRARRPGRGRRARPARARRFTIALPLTLAVTQAVLVPRAARSTRSPR